MGAFFASVAGAVASLRAPLVCATIVACLATELRAAQFTLTWTDNSTNETGFRIERSSDGAGYAEIATVGADVVSYVDANLPNSMTYWYRVRAYNSAGNSGYSNVATGTTPPPASNNAPTITDLGNIAVDAGSSSGAINFTVADVETSAADLVVSAASSNSTLVPTAGIVFAGSGSSRTLTVTPAVGQTGTVTITVTVNDGNLTASDSFVVTVMPPGTSTVDSSAGFVNAVLAQSQTGSFVFQFEATPSASPMDAIVGLSTGSAGAYTDVAAAVRFNPSGFIDVRNGGDYAAAVSMSYTVGTTYQFRMVVNVATHSYSVYVTPSGQAEQLLAADYAFRTEQASVSSLGSWCIRVGSAGTLSVGNATVEVLATNTAPSISNITNRTINEDFSTGAIAFTVGDAETAAANLIVSVESSNTALVPLSNLILGGSGAARTITATPLANLSGSSTITVTVSDGALATSDTFVLTVSAVNDAPVISSIANRTIDQNTSTGTIAFTVGDVETSAGNLTVSAASSNTTLVPAAGISLSGTTASRAIAITPASGQSGTSTITVTVSDGSLSATSTFVLTVNAVNAAPSISDIANRTINEDSSTGAIAFTVGDAETAAGSLVVSATSSNAALVPSGNLVMGGSGASRTITATPVANQFGTSTITVTVSDGTLSASDSFVVTVSAVNDAPTISAIADRSISQNGNTGAISFTIGDIETSAANLSLTATSSNTALASSASVAFGGSGTSRTVSVTPYAGETGTTTITIRVSDGSLTASTSFVLTVGPVDVAPAITTQPASATVIAGSSASFSVAATGTPAPSYQWFHDGSAIAGSIGATLSLNSVQASDGGAYTVVVSNRAGSVTSVDATLTVSERIAILTQPVSQTIAKGATVALSVSASGSGLSYQWYLGAAGDTSSPVSGATSASYSSPKLQASCSYWVRVSAGTQVVNSTAATITVVDKPRTGSGSLKRGNGQLQPMPVLAAGVAADGTFAVMITADGALQMLAVDASSGLVIDAGGVALNDAGVFSFVVEGVGTVTGQVVGNLISGSIVGTDITFSGAIDPMDGNTAGLAGWYNAVVVNSSNDEIIVLAGPDGTAFVMTYVGGQVTGGLTLMDAAGKIAVSLQDGCTLDLVVNGSSGRVTGSTVADGKTEKVSGARAGEALNKRLVNTSVRAQVRRGDELMVAGFVITGSGTKRVLIRAAGPALGSLGVSGALADPVVTLFRQGTASPIGFNDDWSSATNATEVASVSVSVGAFDFPEGSKDAAILVELQAGAYTAHVSGANGVTGAALVEVYDADAGAGSAAIPTQLANISMRGIAGPGDDLVIAGFVVTGNAPKQVLIRAVGSELAEFGVTGVAEDPVLSLYSRVNDQSVQIAANNDWGVDAAAVSAAGDHVGAFELTPGSRSSAMVIWLEPGVYTAHASGNSGTSGVALVEVYELQ